MAATSTMLPLGTFAPSFSLEDVASGSEVSLGDVADAPVAVVAFLCSHCPEVQHMQRAFAEVATAYAPRGVAVVAISANDPVLSPGDTPEKLAEQKRAAGFTFPYLFDATQQVAKAYEAACTPDLFVFDATRHLSYRGRFDASRPGEAEADGADLRAALDALLDGRPVDPNQHPAVGCAITWRPGNEPV